MLRARFLKHTCCLFVGSKFRRRARFRFVLFSRSLSFSIVFGFVTVFVFVLLRFASFRVSCSFSCRFVSFRFDHFRFVSFSFAPFRAVSFRCRFRCRVRFSVRFRRSFSFGLLFHMCGSLQSSFVGFVIVCSLPQSFCFWCYTLFTRSFSFPLSLLCVAHAKRGS